MAGEAVPKIIGKYFLIAKVAQEIERPLLFYTLPLKHFQKKKEKLPKKKKESFFAGMEMAGCKIFAIKNTTSSKYDILNENYETVE